MSMAVKSRSFRRKKKNNLQIAIFIILFGVGGLLFYGLWQTWQWQPAVSGDLLVSHKPQSKTRTDDQTLKIKLPILMYHYIRDYDNPNDRLGKNLSVSPKVFEEELIYLKTEGFQTIDFTDWEKNNPPAGGPPKPIILTFDDGYRDAYTNAFPLLKKHQFKGVFFITTDFIGKNQDYLNWEEIQQMQQGGMSFGSHSLSHADLTKIGNIKLKKELSESKKILEEKTGQTTNSFCYPAGKVDSRVKEATKNAGYQFGLTTKEGIVDSKSERLLLPRMRMKNTDTKEILAKRLK